MRFVLEADRCPDGGFRVRSPEIPEFEYTTAISPHANAGCMDHALDAFVEVLAVRYVKARRLIPIPTTKQWYGRPWLRLPLDLSWKITLSNEMIFQGVNKTEMARRLQKDRMHVDRLLNFHHESKLRAAAAAFQALSRDLVMDSLSYRDRDDKPINDRDRVAVAGSSLVTDGKYTVAKNEVGDLVVTTDAGEIAGPLAQFDPQHLHRQ